MNYIKTIRNCTEKEQPVSRLLFFYLNISSAQQSTECLTRRRLMALAKLA